MTTIFERGGNKMKRSRLILVTLLSILLVFGTAPAVFAEDDLNCLEDFDTQEEAQAVLDADPSDPHDLDRDGDGIACESLPSGDSATSSNNDATEENNDESNDASNDESEEATETGTEEPASSETEESSEEDAVHTSDETSSDAEEGGELPSTATALPLGIAGGLGAMALGALGMCKRK